MKNLIKTVLVIICVNFSGCVVEPYRTTEVASVVLYNHTGVTLEFQGGLNNLWSEQVVIKNQESEEYRYEISENEASLKTHAFPSTIDSFRFFLPECIITMNQEHINTFAARPENGRNGWDIFINNELIKIIGCGN